MSTNYSGVDGVVEVGSQDAEVSGWSADVSVNTYDSTTTADGGWDDESAATKRVEGTFNFLWKPTAPPTGSTLGLAVGAVVALHLYVSKTDDVELTGQALITKLSITSAVKDGVKVAASFVGKGAWTLPSDPGGGSGT